MRQRPYRMLTMRQATNEEKTSGAVSGIGGRVEELAGCEGMEDAKERRAKAS